MTDEPEQADVHDPDGPTGPVIESDEMVVWITHQTGWPPAVVELCLELEHDFMVAIGLVEDPDHVPMVYAAEDWAGSSPEVDDDKLADDAAVHLGVSRPAAADVFAHRMAYLSLHGLVTPDGDSDDEGDDAPAQSQPEPGHRIVYDADASPHLILEGLPLEGSSLTRVDDDRDQTEELERIIHPHVMGLRGWCIEGGGLFELRVPGRGLEFIDHRNRCSVTPDLTLDHALHSAGERTGPHSGVLRNAVAWQIASELVRRHPGELQVIETHPAGGMYDCISVFRRNPRDGQDNLILHMNREMAVTHLTHGTWFGSGGSVRFTWLEALCHEDRRAYVIEQLERTEGLGSPPITPEATHSTIGPRVIAACTARAAFGRKPWDWRNGMNDSAGMDGVGVNDAYFEAVPAAARSAVPQEGDMLGQPAYRFWFLLEPHKGGDPEVRMAIDTVRGLAYVGQHEHDLLELYQHHGRRLDPVVNTVCPPVS